MALGDGEGEERLPEVLFIEHRVHKPIPDLGVVQDPVTFPLDMVIKEIEVSVDIRHTYRGDLRVTLYSPNGADVILENRTGGSQDDIIRDYRSAGARDKFASILGASANGDWHLKVEDLAQQDVGVIMKWGLAITL